MKKIYIIILSAVLIPGLASAVFDTVTQDDGTTVSIDTGSYTIGGAFESYTANSDNIQFSVSGNSVFQIKSTSRHTLTLSGNNCTITQNQCTSSFSFVSVRCNEDVSQHTITFTPSTTACTSSAGSGASSSSSGGGGGGGGAGSVVKKTTTTDKIEVTAPVETKSQETSCGLTTKKAYKYAGSSAVFYVTENCTKRPFKNPNIFFTYFNSWNDVQSVTKEKVIATPDDELSFMPWGPNFDPKYGALVKITSDPKVYLLLGTEKYWITSEDVFTTLGYSWNWIEDIDSSLLDKYSIGTEINYTDRHPNYTLVKYKNDPKVYRLEEGKKRHIKNEAAFNKLKYRWDRIVTIADTETYPDGAEME